MITTAQISDGRDIQLVDLDQITHAQGLALATAAADVLIRSGMIRDDAPLDGPNILQFLGELGDYLVSKQTGYVVNVSYDAQSPALTIGPFPSLDDAADNVAHQVKDAAKASGLAISDDQSRALHAEIMSKNGFCHTASFKDSTKADASLRPVRDAIGWVEYDICVVTSPVARSS